MGLTVQPVTCGMVPWSCVHHSMDNESDGVRPSSSSTKVAPSLRSLAGRPILASVVGRFLIKPNWTTDDGHLLSNK